MRDVLFWLTGKLPGKVIKGPDGAAFLERYHVARLPLGGEVVIHRFVASDPDRGLHDHPWRWAISVLLAGSYDELIVPRKDAPLRERFRRRLRAPAINRVKPRRYHRVLLPPRSDVWTLFVTGPRIKPWGFLAHPDAHRYAATGSTARDHNDRRGVARTLAGGDAYADESADVSFTAERLEYRPFTTAVDAPDRGWWRTAPTGAVLRDRREALAVADPPMFDGEERVLLVSGRAGAGKDFVATALAQRYPGHVTLIRIGDATKAIYAQRAGLDFERLRDDRAFKEQHRAALTALYDELRADNEHFELERVESTLRARPPSPSAAAAPPLVIVVDLRMRYELAWFAARVAPDRLLHVRLVGGASNAGLGGNPLPTDGDATHPTETDLGGVAPDLELVNDRVADLGGARVVGELFAATCKLAGLPGHGFSNVRAFLAKSLSHDDDYECEVLGRRFRVHPQVMSPRYSYSPEFTIRHWDAAKLAGARVLDLGCGCGVLGIFAALEGAADVVAIDINREALRTTRHNAEQHRVTLDVRESDGFANVDGTFDIIVFNAPYFDHPIDDGVPLTRGVFDPGHELLRRTLAEAPRFLRPGGELWLVLGSDGLSGARTTPLAGILDDAVANVQLRIVDARSELRGHRRTLYVLAPR